MADGTKIEWSEATWNPIRARLRSDPSVVGWHCEHASPGCVNCYSETRNLSGRCNLGTKLPFKPGHLDDVEVYLDEKVLVQPLHWHRPRMIFPCSMTDLFGRFVTDEMLDRVFAVMALCPQHTFQVLTKRAKRMREYLTKLEDRRTLSVEQRIRLESKGLWVNGNFPHAGQFVPGWPLPNVWLGVSVEDQQRADERIPDQLATPAAVRWLSGEPLLGSLDLEEWLSGLDWIVAGGESGRSARPCHPDWARSLRDQCAAAGVPFFWKQWGEWAPGQTCVSKIGRFAAADLGRDGWMSFDHFQSGDEPGCPPHVVLLGKKRAGRLLDGVLHDAMPDLFNREPERPTTAPVGS